MMLQDVDIKKPGLIASMFDTGTLLVNSASGAHLLTLTWMPDPEHPPRPRPMAALPEVAARSGSDTRLNDACPMGKGGLRTRSAIDLLVAQ
jgi:hypothetical protein